MQPEITHLPDGHVMYEWVPLPSTVRKVRAVVREDGSGRVVVVSGAGAGTLNFAHPDARQAAEFLVETIDRTFDWGVDIGTPAED